MQTNAKQRILLPGPDRLTLGDLGSNAPASIYARPMPGFRYGRMTCKSV